MKYYINNKVRVLHRKAGSILYNGTNTRSTTRHQFKRKKEKAPSESIDDETQCYHHILLCLEHNALFGNIETAHTLKMLRNS